MRRDSRVDAPLVSGSVMGRGNDPVRNSVPHLRVPAVEVLLHPECRLSLLVLSLPHPLKLYKRFLERSRPMLAGGSGLRLFSSTVDELLLSCEEGTRVKDGTRKETSRARGDATNLSSGRRKPCLA